MTALTRKAAYAALCMLMAVLTTGCVHEWPESPEGRTATLTVRHELPWDLFEWTHPFSSRTEPDDLTARYIFAIYPAGADKEPPVKKVIAYRSGTDRQDFDIDIDLDPGEWDIRVWSDNAGSVSGISPFYDPSDFEAITYATPFIGGDARKDAFVGTARISVPDIIEDRWPDSHIEVTLRRPLTAFAFIATDLREFMEQEETRTRDQSAMTPPLQLPPISLDDYTARISYTGFLPTVYHHFSDRPIDSSTGMGFRTGVSRLNEAEALTGYDYVFINGKESTVRVSLDYYHKDGTHIAHVASFDIPVSRNRCTVVRGEFLTSRATGSTGIDPGFDGDFNIEFK